MKVTKKIVVIGGGPAGVEAALTASSYSDNVEIISDGPVGDWNKMLPSRVWLSALDHGNFGLELVADQAKRVAQDWQDYVSEELKKKNVKITRGQASFNSANQVIVNIDSGQKESITADSIIIATGSVPFFPPSLKPDAEKVFSPDTISHLKRLPKSILVVGDGCVGFEFVDIFSRLGINVTWIALEGGPIIASDSDVDTFLRDILKRRGVQFEPGLPVTLEREKSIVAVRQNGDRFEAEMAFVSIGERPNLSSLNIEVAGIETNKRGAIIPDEFGRTNISNVYIAGGAIKFDAGNLAMSQARTAALHATNQNPPPFDHKSTVITFGSNPQVAQVGTLSNDGGPIYSALVHNKAVLASYINDDLEGFVKVAWDGESRVVGGAAIGKNATEALAPVAMAIKMNASIEDLSRMQGPHPTFSELPYMAARMKSGIKKQDIL